MLTTDMLNFILREIQLVAENKNALKLTSFRNSVG